ncbi:MAG: hypothetical protein LBQ00_09420 [Syntrophobacterales bacterium]|jgi:hypothetical protein|nr:hypothetical protein [Syntrophobacterales bacterium]
MKTSGQEKEKLRQALGQAYRDKENIEVGQRWRTGLMAQVREIGPIRPEPGFLPSFESVVWRLTPLTSPLVLILILVACFIGLNLGSNYDALYMLVNGEEEMTLSAIFST